MKRIFNKVTNKVGVSSEETKIPSKKVSSPARKTMHTINSSENSSAEREHQGHSKPKQYTLPNQKQSFVKKATKFELGSIEEKMNESELNIQNTKGMDKKEYYNRLSLERINFVFDEYGKYPDETFHPSVFFFKFLAMKPDLEGRKVHKLRLFIPDTIIFNDVDSNYWIFTDVDGNVVRTEAFNDADIIDKFKSPTNDENELIGVSKAPNYKGEKLEDNHLELLNIEELERHLFSKNSNQYAIQRFVKCRGPKAFVCRSVWRRDKPPYVYILTNRANYHDNISNQNVKFVINSKLKNSYFPFYATSGKHLEETMVYMNNIVKFIESHSDILFDELVGDFVKDEAGIWWFINLKALKVKNLEKFIGENGENYNWPNLEYFTNKRKKDNSGLTGKTRKFDYQTKIKCKFCGIDYSSVKLKYNLTTKMIIETDKMLKHIGTHITFIERPDLKHTDCSKIYLPYRVCEDCYLLFETMNDIKNHQIEIANFFRNPVDQINFGLDYMLKEKPKDNTLCSGGVNLNSNTNCNTVDNIEDYTAQNHTQNSNYSHINDNININPNMMNTSINHVKSSSSTSKSQYLYRILIMFTDLFWNEVIPVPGNELYLCYNFIGNWYKVKIGTYYSDLDYFNINFFKIFYIVCDETEGFIEYIEKNRHMEIKLGYFKQKEENGEETAKVLSKDIVIEDNDICKNIDDLVEFASVELSLQGLKYGEKYRNTLNGLLFKKEKPHYVGKLRCVIRISKEGRDREKGPKEGKELFKTIDISKYNLRKHFNLYIPPVHFVISDELQDYWLELVERHKLRESILNNIFATMKKNNIKYVKKKHKEDIFRTLESLISHYLNTNS